jgi:hypothetical protein
MGAASSDLLTDRSREFYCPSEQFANFAPIENLACLRGDVDSPNVASH